MPNHQWNSTVLDSIQSLLEEVLGKELPDVMTKDQKDHLLKIFHKKLATLSLPEDPTNLPTACNFIGEVTRQAEEIETTTEKAACAIMELAERQIEAITRTRHLLETAKGVKSSTTVVLHLRDSLTSQHADLMAIITAASFHDLTTQRCRKIASEMQKLHTPTDKKSMVDPPPVSGDKACDSPLKGPVLDVNQASVDDLLTLLDL